VCRVDAHQDSEVTQPVGSAPDRVAQTGKVKHAHILLGWLIVKIFKLKRRAQPPSG
jgi:hypothetical protein